MSSLVARGAAVAVMAGAAALAIVGQKREIGQDSSPRIIRVRTVAKIPFGAGAGSLARLTPLHYPYHFTWQALHFLPVDIDTDGNVTMVVNDRELCKFSSAGKVRRMALPWLTKAHVSVHVICSDREGYLMGIQHTNPFWGQLVRTDASGLPRWALGKYWPIASTPATGGFTLPLPAQADDKAYFSDWGGLISLSNGDFCDIHSAPGVRQWNNRGRQVADYFLDIQPGRRYRSYGGEFTIGATAMFTAHVTPGGEVFSQNAAAEKDGWLIGLYLERHGGGKPFSMTYIDLSALGQVFPLALYLVGNDAAGNLYFQYMYGSGGNVPYNYRDIPRWQGPMAIARIGSDNKAVMVFDVYSHYRAEIEAANQRADASGRKRGPIGVGSVAKVDNTGAIYLEVADATHYRIDKITFSKP